jgi:single-strand DNA-binding protein
MKRYSFNTVKFGGCLGADVDLRYTPQGSPVASFSVCYSNKAKNSGKEYKTWMKVTVWGTLAEQCKTFLKKGSPVIIEEGALATRTWERRDGVKVTETYINAQKIDMMQMENQETPKRNQAENGYQPDGVDSDDCPF